MAPLVQQPPTDGFGELEASDYPPAEEIEAGNPSSVAFARRALAFAGALLLLAGQFCPMLTVAKNLNVTFFDYTTKAAWLLGKAAMETMDALAQESESRQQPRERVRAERSSSSRSQDNLKPLKPSEGIRTTALVFGLILTLCSPLCPVALVVIAVLILRAIMKDIGLVASRMNPKRLTLAGVTCLLALGVLFLGPMLVLWAIPGALSGLAFGVTSFGFGWGILVLGSVLLILSGAVRNPTPL